MEVLRSFCGIPKQEHVLEEQDCHGVSKAYLHLFVKGFFSRVGLPRSAFFCDLYFSFSSRANGLFPRTIFTCLRSGILGRQTIPVFGMIFLKNPPFYIYIFLFSFDIQSYSVSPPPLALCLVLGPCWHCFHGEGKVGTVSRQGAMFQCRAELELLVVTS